MNEGNYYNVTIKVDKTVEFEWYDWMKNIHIPDVMKTGCFISSTFNKVMFVDDDEGAMYTVQYLCENMKKLQEYQGSHAPRLQGEHHKKYKDKCVAFRSVMEVREKFYK